MDEKHYKLRFLPLFEDDLNGIVDYIAERPKNPQAAEAFVDDVERAIRERLSARKPLSRMHRQRNGGIRITASMFATTRFFTW